MIFRQIVFYALLVGALAGLGLTVAQAWQTNPIIFAAEAYEGSGAQDVADHHHDHGHGGAREHSHSADEWVPEDGFERTAFTLLSNIITAMGFALVVMVSMMAALELRLHKLPLDWRAGLLWGIAGYLVFWLAPALGMRPEIPLQTAAPLEHRQLWWLLTVICTAGGLAGLVFGKSPWRWLMPALLVVPYLVGSPHIDGPMFAGQPPAAAAELEQLAKQFFNATAVTNAILWAVLGPASLWAVKRISALSATVAASPQTEPPTA